MPLQQNSADVIIQLIGNLIITFTEFILYILRERGKREKRRRGEGKREKNELYT